MGRTAFEWNPVPGATNKALEQFQKAQELLRQGNFAGYDEQQKQLVETLRRLREQAASLP